MSLISLIFLDLTFTLPHYCTAINIVVMFLCINARQAALYSTDIQVKWQSELQKYLHC